jgi:hypothetical protein
LTPRLTHWVIPGSSCHLPDLTYRQVSGFWGERKRLTRPDLRSSRCGARYRHRLPDGADDIREYGRCTRGTIPRITRLPVRPSAPSLRNHLRGRLVTRPRVRPTVGAQESILTEESAADQDVEGTALGARPVLQQEVADAFGLCVGCASCLEIDSIRQVVISVVALLLQGPQIVHVGGPTVSAELVRKGRGRAPAPCSCLGRLWRLDNLVGCLLQARVIADRRIASRASGSAVTPAPCDAQTSSAAWNAA